MYNRNQTFGTPAWLCQLQALGGLCGLKPTISRRNSKHQILALSRFQKVAGLHHCSIKRVKHVGSLPVAGLNKELKHFQISLLKAELLEGNRDCLLCFQSLVFIWPLWAIRILITLIITSFNPSSALYLFSVLGELDLPVCFPSVKLR